MELRKTYISKIAPRKNYTGSPAALVYRVSPGIIGPLELGAGLVGSFNEVVSRFGKLNNWRGVRCGERSWIPVWARTPP